VTRQMIQNVKQANVIELMCEVLELSESSEKKVAKAVEKLGIQTFFTSIDALDIDEAEKDRIKALKEVIEAKAKSLEALEGGQ
jgi:N-methylhydantoinase B/oxoprolinase/acetone carboxylase alpha subunit